MELRSDIIMEREHLMQTYDHHRENGGVGNEIHVQADEGIIGIEITMLDPTASVLHARGAWEREALLDNQDLNAVPPSVAAADEAGWGLTVSAHRDFGLSSTKVPAMASQLQTSRTMLRGQMIHFRMRHASPIVIGNLNRGQGGSTDPAGAGRRASAAQTGQTIEEQLRMLSIAGKSVGAAARDAQEKLKKKKVVKQMGADSGVVMLERVLDQTELELDIAALATPPSLMADAQVPHTSGGGRLAQRSGHGVLRAFLGYEGAVESGHPRKPTSRAQKAARFAEAAASAGGATPSPASRRRAETTKTKATKSALWDGGGAAAMSRPKSSSLGFKNSSKAPPAFPGKPNGSKLAQQHAKRLKRTQYSASTIDLLNTRMEQHIHGRHGMAAHGQADKRSGNDRFGVGRSGTILEADKISADESARDSQMYGAWESPWHAPVQWATIASARFHDNWSSPSIEVINDVACTARANGLVLVNIGTMDFNAGSKRITESEASLSKNRT